MAYTIVALPVPSGKYGKKSPYKMMPQYITVHNTANDASARNEASYMKNNNSGASFHVQWTTRKMRVFFTHSFVKRLANHL